MIAPKPPNSLTITSFYHTTKFYLSALCPSWNRVSKTYHLTTFTPKSFTPKLGLTQTRLKVIGLTVIGLAVIGCQPTQEGLSDSAITSSQQENLNKDTNTNDNQLEGMAPSIAAQAAIDNFEAEFVSKRLNLQQSQQAEYEALQAADTAFDTSSGSSLPTATVATEEHQTTRSNSSINKRTSETDNSHADSQVDETLTPTTDKASPLTDSAEDADAQDVSLLDLPLVDTPIQPPERLTAIEIASRYKVAMQSLYLPENLPLPTQAVDTLLNIAMLTPEVFNEPQLANRLVLKMPALARMLKQYQIWEQIEAQQSAELQALKDAQIKAQEEQAKKFDQLVAEFDNTINEYDEQIAKYEKKLAEFK